MDRVKFFQSIELENGIANIFADYFDQLMALYSLLPDTDCGISIKPSAVDQSILVTIFLHNQEARQWLLQTINATNNICSIYGHNFSISMIQEDGDMIYLRIR